MQFSAVQCSAVQWDLQKNVNHGEFMCAPGVGEQEDKDEWYLGEVPFGVAS